VVVPGRTGLFFVEAAPRREPRGNLPGFVVVFVPVDWLEGSLGTSPGGLEIRVGGGRVGALHDSRGAATRSFTAAASRWSVLVPRGSPSAAARALAWSLLVAGAIVAALAGVLGVNAARRAKAQDELDRIFKLSSDLIAVADFDGHFTRVNPAAEQVLGYTEEELLATPYLEFVHPDDRERTAALADAIAQCEAPVSSENRYVRKDGSLRVLEWTSTPVAEDGLMYTVARDVTERRQAEAELQRLADEQAALRRMATLVARGVPPAEIFSAVSQEVGRLLGTDLAAVGRFDPDGPSYIVVGVAKSVEVITSGSRWELDDSMASAQVFRSGRSARVDGVDWSAVSAHIGAPARRMGIVSTVSSPIVVDGRLWGAMTVLAKEPLPLQSAERLEKFTGLVAIAIANAESREALRQLADEQAALRRVATLAAEGAPPSAVLDAVAGEMKALLDADQVALNRFEPGDEILVLAHRGLDVGRTPVGSRMSSAGDSVTAMVRRTGRPARMEHIEGAGGVLAELARATGLRWSVSAPIVVEGRLWGLVTASWKGEQSPAPDTEQRMTRFAQLLETAIANADSRDQLTASRARLLTEGDEARRRVVRDLHDGAQQRLVQSILTLKLAQEALRENDGTAESLVGDALEQVEQGNAELRELAHGILPPVLTRGGLRAAVKSVVRRLDLPVEVDVPAERFAPEIEASAYFIVAEALTNVVKHSRATRAEVSVSVDEALLRVEVRDDGIGGADPAGHGLVGIEDRVSALGGRLDIASPARGGTLVSATLPLGAG
jgi:PAS domain S-box-containing protein